MADWYEQLWEQAPADPEPWAWRRRRGWLAAEVRPGERVLDLGCGAGRFLRVIAEAGAVTVGVEVAEAALARARRLAPEAELHRVAPDGDLPFADGTFDLVWCSEVLEHVADTATFLSELRRVLRAGGRALITTPAHGRVRRVALAAVSFESHFDPFGQHLRFYSRVSLARALAAHDFAPVAVRTRTAGLGSVAVRGTLVARACAS